MANYINKYTDIAAYNADEGKQYPNVSYMVATDEVKWEKKTDPVHIVCKYNVTSTSDATNLLDSNSNITYQIIDGVKQDTVQTAYTFDTLGEHIVEYKLDGTSIGDYTFNYCESLTNFTIPDSITSIGNGAFNNCTGLTNITIPDSVTSIGERAFGACTNLTSINIPNVVTSINDQVFASCESLTSINIPDSVTSIGNGAFTSCTSLTNIVVDSGNTVFDSRDNCNAIINTSTNELILGCKNTVIPNTVTSIGNYAFDQCRGLTNITIPNGVTYIGDNAFGSCSNLTNITIPDSVTSIGNSVFQNCSGLTNITIPDSVTSIGNSAFNYCPSLRSVTIPDSVTSIGNSAFFNCRGLTSVTIGNGVTSIGISVFYNCSVLRSVTIQATTPPTLVNANAFKNTSKNLVIYVPAESVDAYKTATNWSSLASRIKPISE